MSKKKPGLNPNGQSKYETCAKCGLHIRCGNVESHEKGWHHRTTKRTS